ncbi:MAG: hypothetical protein KME43_00170 [Myxacorys chilensis ATA2-1-KO14]|jgi:hypothetical protein|nr:hypothetical protein [Myxacorys chilensis ATA2-1-KO14]
MIRKLYNVRDEGRNIRDESRNVRGESRNVRDERYDNRDQTYCDRDQTCKPDSTLLKRPAKLPYKKYLFKVFVSFLSVSF